MRRLIFTVRPFRMGDFIEVLDTAEKPGAKGRVVDINLLYTTLEDHDAAQDHPALLQIPNTLVFQRVVRRWRGAPPPTGKPHVAPATPAPPAVEAAPATQVGPSTTPSV